MDDLSSTENMINVTDPKPAHILSQPQEENNNNFLKDTTDYNDKNNLYLDSQKSYTFSKDIEITEV